MPELLKTLPNQLTAARLVLIPVMWLLALLHMPALIGAGILLCFATDVLDGYVARRLGQVSAAGSRFDSLADNLLSFSGLLWIAMFVPDVYRENALVCGIGILLYVASILLGLLKFKRFGNLHLHTSRAAGVVMYLFLSVTLIRGEYVPAFFYIVAGAFSVSSAETLLLQLMMPSVDEHMGSLVLALRRRKAAQR